MDIEDIFKELNEKFDEYHDEARQCLFDGISDILDTNSSGQDPSAHESRRDRLYSDECEFEWDPSPMHKDSESEDESISPNTKKKIARRKIESEPESEPESELDEPPSKKKSSAPELGMNSGEWTAVEKEAFDTSIEENGFTKLGKKDGSAKIVFDAVKTRSLTQIIQLSHRLQADVKRKHLQLGMNLNSGRWTTVEDEAFDMSIEENGFTKLGKKDGSAKKVFDAVKTRSLRQILQHFRDMNRMTGDEAMKAKDALFNDRSKCLAILQRQNLKLDNDGDDKRGCIIRTNKNGDYVNTRVYADEIWDEPKVEAQSFVRVGLHELACRLTNPWTVDMVCAHKCDKKNCCNPRHLDRVSGRVNNGEHVVRSNQPARKAAVLAIPHIGLPQTWRLIGEDNDLHCQPAGNDQLV